MSSIDQTGAYLSVSAAFGLPGERECGATVLVIDSIPAVPPATTGWNAAALFSVWAAAFPGTPTDKRPDSRAPPLQDRQSTQVNAPGASGGITSAKCQRCALAFEARAVLTCGFLSCACLARQAATVKRRKEGRKEEWPRQSPGACFEKPRIRLLLEDRQVSVVHVSATIGGDYATVGAHTLLALSSLA